ncbi:hypothetical protein [Paenibacillus sanguinis]|uniref:hypothetical protein n=1 Tax=Paenibacillus sanguinis TaxID=225906 RepID=UPI00037BE0E5|nr:hypothetical protein [Paenibacillus sanguinis]
MVLFTLLSYVVIVLVDQVQNYKNGKKRDFYVSCAMCMFSFTIAILLASGLDLPSPVKPIEQWISQVFGS